MADLKITLSKIDQGRSLFKMSTRVPISKDIPLEEILEAFLKELGNWERSTLDLRKLGKAKKS